MAAPLADALPPGGADLGPPRVSARTAALLLAGALLLGLLVYHTGLAPVVDSLAALGWGAPLALLPYAVVAYLDTVGWACTLPRGHRVTLGSLFAMRLAGEAVNTIGAVAGEPLKAVLLRAAGVAGADAVASIVIAKTALTVSQIALVVIGIGVLLLYLDLPALGMVWLVPLVLAGATVSIAMVRVQRIGPAGWLWRWLGRLAPQARWVARHGTAATAVDRRLMDYYALERAAFAGATAWHLAGWIGNVVEVAVLFALLGHPVSIVEAFLIETAAQPLRATGVLFPGALGTQEVGGTVVCHWLGIAEGPAVAFWLLRRARETIFDAVGLAYLMRWTRRSWMLPQSARR
jgi:hypothetical protein